MTRLEFSDSVVIDRGREEIYALVSDVTRMGQEPAVPRVLVGRSRRGSGDRISYGLHCLTGHFVDPAARGWCPVSSY